MGLSAFPNDAFRIKFCFCAGHIKENFEKRYKVTIDAFIQTGSISKILFKLKTLPMIKKLIDNFFKFFHNKSKRICSINSNDIYSFYQKFQIKI